MAIKTSRGWFEYVKSAPSVPLLIDNQARASLRPPPYLTCLWRKGRIYEIFPHDANIAAQLSRIVYLKQDTGAIISLDCRRSGLTWMPSLDTMRPMTRSLCIAKNDFDGFAVIPFFSKSANTRATSPKCVKRFIIFVKTYMLSE